MCSATSSQQVSHLSPGGESRSLPCHQYTVYVPEQVLWLLLRRRHPLGEMLAWPSIAALRRRQSDSASSLRAGEGLSRAGGNNVPGTSPASIQEEPEEGKAADVNFATSDLPPGGHACPLSSSHHRRPSPERLGAHA